MERLLQILQSRRIDRIAAAYAVAGWVLVQVASVALPAFEAPAWVLRAFIIFVLLGFPLTIGLAWLYAPHLAASEGPRRTLGRAHLMALSLFGGLIVFSIGDIAYQLSHAPARTEAPQVAAPAGASIAVLPFVNMSGDPGKEYFSDGISEELLNDLANIPDLLVAARTSSFAFKGKNGDIKDIARILAVRTVLEGSVRESGAHIRITAQLINAADGYHLWSETYDRSLTDVLVLEDDIARAITEALTHKLLPSHGPAAANKPNAINAEAYRKYLEGQHDLGPRTKDGSEKALALFKDVTAIQPDFAEGFAALGRAYINVAEYHSEQKDLIPAADVALARALALDPRNVSALASHLDLALHKQDWQAASADARSLQAINPNSAPVLHEMFRYYQLLGFPELALAAARGAVKLDPLSFVDRLNVAAALNHVARFGKSAAAANDARALEPNQPYILAILCTGYAHSGRLNDARAIGAKLVAAKDQSDADGCDFDIAVGEHRLDDARTIMDKLASQFPDGDLAATDLGDSYAVAADYPDAVKWLARAYDLKEFALFTIPFDKAIAPAFFDEPGWKAIEQKPLYVDWQNAHDSIAADLAAGGR